MSTPNRKPIILFSTDSGSASIQTAERIMVKRGRGRGGEIASPPKNDRDLARFSADDGCFGHVPRPDRNMRLMTATKEETVLDAETRYICELSRARVRHLTPHLRISPQDTTNWINSKGIRLGWPLTFNDGHCGSEIKLGRVDKLVDLSAENLMCSSIDYSNVAKIRRDIALGKLNVKEEKVELGQLADMIRQWNESGGTTLTHIKDGRARLIFCISRVKLDEIEIEAQ